MPRLFASTARLALWYMFGVAVGVSVLLGSAYLFTQRAMEKNVDLVIDTEIESLREDYRGGGLKRLVSVLDQRDDDWGRLGAAYLLIDHRGAPLGGNLGAWPKNSTRSGRWIEFDMPAVEQGKTVMHPVRAAVVALDGNRLLVGTDVSERLRFARRMRETTYWGMGLTGAFMVLTAWWFSRRVAARVLAVAEACESIISGDLSRRLPIEHNADEFDQLAGTVNGMLDRIEQQTAAVRITFNSAAHDLRAPLQRIRGRLETALLGAKAGDATDVAVQGVLEDLERVQRTLAVLLQIAQAEAGGAGLPPERVDLARLARELGELYAPEAQTRRLSLRVSADEAAYVSGHQQLLAQLLTNLIENSIKYVPAGGAVELAVRHSSGEVSVGITDNGPGIPNASHADMLLPFRRLERDFATAGSGLGLSLVAAVVRLHHGRLEMRELSPGLAVTCTFAAVEAAA
jgi:signal transduction histidine kinase